VSTRARDLATTPTREMLEVTTAEDCEFVLRSRDFEFHRPEDHYSDGHVMAEPMLRSSLLHLWGEDHFGRRRLESPLFRHETLKQYEEELVIPRLREEIAAIKAAAGQDGMPRTDVITLAHRVFLVLVAKLVGLDAETEEDEEHLLDVVERLERGLRVRYATNPDELIAMGLDAVDEINRDFLIPSWERRERDRAAGIERNDLLTIMQENKEHFLQWGDEVFLRETTLFVSASTGSSTREMALAIDEIETWIDAHPEDAPLRTDPAFLRAAFEESLRYLQSVREVGRVAARDVTLPSGIEVKAGELVKAVLIRGSQEKFGPAGDSFDPHRTVPDDADPYGYAFGGGRHTCIGKWLVLGQTTGRLERHGTAVAMLLELYRAGMRRDPDNPAKLKKTHTRRFDTYPIVFQQEA
jgi:cytochrome P450